MDVINFLLVIAALSWLMTRGTERLGYNWQWYRVPQYILSFANGDFVAGPLLQGLMVTLRITAMSLLLAFVFGLVTALFRLSNSFVARALARGYLECIRNTPLLVQLFFIYFVLSPVFDMSRFASAVLALSLFEGAYASEIFRAGIVSIQELTFQGMELMSATYLTFEVWITVTALYFILTAALSLSVERLEIHMRRSEV